MRTPCTCAEHKDGAPTEIDGHRFERAADEVRQGDQFLERWRYVCSCGSRGRWTFQSDNVPYHAWLRHVAKAGPS
jgi:hypothetical protein